MSSASGPGSIRSLGAPSPSTRREPRPPSARRKRLLPKSLNPNPWTTTVPSLPRGLDVFGAIHCDAPTPYREALKPLTELEGVTQRTAAEMMGVSLSGMKSRVQRGRERLRGLLEDCCEIALDARGRVIGCEPRANGKQPVACCCGEQDSGAAQGRAPSALTSKAVGRDWSSERRDQGSQAPEHLPGSMQ